jgi:hypothetical protein
MPGDSISGTATDADAVTVGKHNVQQTVSMEAQRRDDTDRYLADSNIKLEFQLGRLVDRLERMMERINDFERRLIAIEASVRRTETASSSPFPNVDRVLVALLSLTMLAMFGFSIWSAR